jgi:hypothetical protein
MATQADDDVLQEGHSVLDDELRNRDLRELIRGIERDQRAAGGNRPGLSPLRLAGLLETVAADPRLWEPCVRHEPSSRWYGSLFRDDVVDLWLLTWQQDNSTDLHDHGGSSGAFRVLSGSLAEFRPTSGPRGAGLARHARTVGETVAFGPRLVHDVHNVEATAAVSLHVYSPPLTSMTYYDLADSGSTGALVSPRHTEPVDVRPSDGPVAERALTVEA